MRRLDAKARPPSSRSKKMAEGVANRKLQNRNWDDEVDLGVDSIAAAMIAHCRIAPSVKIDVTRPAGRACVGRVN